MTVIDRDLVLASRIALAADDARKLVSALDALVAHPPMAGDDQEGAIRSIEEHISHSLWRCGRLKEFVKNEHGAGGVGGSFEGVIKASVK